MGLLEEQKAERTERILETARRLIAERGYEGVNMRDLAEESRVSVPTVYKLCGDKNEVLARAVHGQFNSLLGAFTSSTGKEGLERVMAIVEGCGREMVRLSKYAHAVLEVLIGSGQMGSVSELIAGALSDGVEEALREMAKKKQLAEWVDERVLAEQLTGHIILAALQWQTGHLDDKSLFPAMEYGVCTLLAGAARGGAVRRLQERARKSQKHSLARRHTGKSVVLSAVKR